ncbi:MAG: hypothetical protein CM15mV111_030 [uncultured marine virus]|nr:MAG: hypothetical protein CM15mV111_030 [uncultured marine virus]
MYSLNCGRKVQEVVKKSVRRLALKRRPRKQMAKISDIEFHIVSQRD